MAELVISLAIIAFIVGAAITTFKPYDKGISHLYSNIYYVLDRALYNTTSYWIPNNEAEREPFKDSVTNPKTGENVTINANEGAKRLCRALTEYINPVEDSNRDNVCREGASKTVTDMGTDDLFTPDNVMFTATNGMRFWISKRFPASKSLVEYKPRFFIIYVDLNGKRGPNSMYYEKGSSSNNWKTKDPDIFAFAALETGRICPLGIPEVEPRYLTTRVLYQEEDETGQLIYRYSSPSRPYVYSKAQAWGYYLPVNEQQENEEVNDDEIIAEEPLSYNGYVRKEINPDTKIYSSFLNKNQTMADYVQKDPYNLSSDGIFNIHLMSEEPHHENNDITKPNIGGYGCSQMSAEECYVQVDKYVD